jgi:cytochrome c-type biogenesis protein CcmH
VRERGRLIISHLVTAGLALFVVMAVVTAPPSPVDRALAIGERIRCPVCQGESIADSPAGLARDMMTLIRQRLAEGATDSQIIGELLASFSGAALLDPPISGQTLWLWLAPVGVTAAGIWAVTRTRKPPAQPQDQERRRVFFSPRMAVGTTLLVVAGAVTVSAVAQSRQQNPQSLVSGVAGGDIDLDSVSNQTMEAVIAANSEHPQVNGMRMALAERYFEERQYQLAFPHYQAVLDSQPPASLAAVALTRMGWMVYEGNGEVELATDLFDQALEAAPGDALALYLKGRVIWCGAGETEAAAELFRLVLDAPALDPAERGTVETDLAAAAAGTACS